MQRFNKKDLAKTSGPEYMVWWALMEAMGKCPSEYNEQLFDKREVVDVVFQMNGVDLDFRAVMNHWQSQIGGMIAEKAQELVDSRVSDLYDLIDELKEHIKTQLTKEK